MCGQDDFDDDCDTVNEVSTPYSVSPSPTFAQLDGGATKSISFCSELFPHIHPSPDARVRVADGRELGEDLGEGSLNRKSGFPEGSHFPDHPAELGEAISPITRLCRVICIHITSPHTDAHRACFIMVMVAAPVVVRI
jgi:hypothetical protein